MCLAANSDQILYFVLLLVNFAWISKNAGIMQQPPSSILLTLFQREQFIVYWRKATPEFLIKVSLRIDSLIRPSY